MTYYVTDFPDRTFHQNEKTYTYFGGTAYLGLQTDTAFQNLFIKNLKKYGTNYSASRKSNVRFSIYEEAETFLAHVIGSKACITISSGYLAGQLVSAYFNKPSYKSFYAPSTHAALHRQNTKNYETFEEVRTGITAHLKNNPVQTPVLYFDTINFKGNTYPHFDWLKMLPLENIILVADDSHGFGIIGDCGEGVYKMLQSLASKELIVCGSLGKGFGIQAGGIFGNLSLINELMEADMFIASSPAASCSLATFIQAQDIYHKKRSILHKHIKLFKEGIHHLSLFCHMENYPVFGYSDEELSNHLIKNNTIPTHFNYPNENADVVSRIVLSAHHTDMDILNLIATVNRYPTKHPH
jgi:8-amino-7-oxononanoate synthase